jgi:hypothetical protein
VGGLEEVGPMRAERFGMTHANQTDKTSALSTSGDGKADGLSADWKKGLETLATARDEVALKLHLASLDAKSEWEKLDTSVREAHHFHTASKATEAEKYDAVANLLAKVKAFGERLTKN